MESGIKMAWRQLFPRRQASGGFELLRRGIVREITGRKRGRVYRFDRYIDTLDDGWSAPKAAIERSR